MLTNIVALSLCCSCNRLLCILNPFLMGYKGALKNNEVYELPSGLNIAINNYYLSLEFKHTIKETCIRFNGHATKVPTASFIVIMSSSSPGIDNEASDSTTTSTLTFRWPSGRCLPCSVSLWMLCTFPCATRRREGGTTNNLQLETP